MELRRDCRHFPGDRPCRLHKETGVTCSVCDSYAPRGTRILIVKLDALGDVLRTTCLLPSLRREYQPCYITWMTSPAAMDLFSGNPLVDEMLAVGDGALPMLIAREFDLVINPDAAQHSCAIASIASGRKKYGFVMSPGGVVVPLNEAADQWLLLGSFDQLKRENKKTYQQILHDICEIDSSGQEIVLGLTDEEKQNVDQVRSTHGVTGEMPLIGINTGAGARWEFKKWRVDGFIELIDSLLKETDASIVLLGGDGERERNSVIASNFGQRVLNPGQQGLRDFIRIVDLCDVVLTGDTLALHVALGLKKRVVALFGPTSAHEVDMYGLGTKIVPDLDCVCCYRMRCDRKPSCMDLIGSREVFEAVITELASIESEVLV